MQEKNETMLEEIIVTGTLLRGLDRPVGTEVISMDAQQIQATGAMSTTQLLQSIPQNQSFNNLQYSTSAANVITTNRPNLRDLPQTTGASSTLVLLNGHRVVGMGVTSTSPDVDIVPPAVLQRVEIVPDGGSAIYGSDAVAGVINFITRKDFEGVEVDAKYGNGDHYNATDASVTGGFNWDTGSAYIGYNYAGHDALSGGNLDWVRMYPNFRQDVPALQQPVIGTQCTPGNVRVNGQSYALPYTTGNAVPGTVNQCDPSDGTDVYPKENRDSVMLGFAQELGDKVSLEARAFYMNRNTKSKQDGFPATVTVTPGGSPYRDQYLATGDPSEIQAVDLVVPGTLEQEIKLDTYGIYPTLTVQLPAGWQLRALAGYGESTTENHYPAPDSNSLSSAVRAGLINPYDVATSNPAAMAAVKNFEIYGKTDQSLFEGSLIADGELFSLPGGAVKLAVGGQYQDQGYDVQAGNIVTGTEDSGSAGVIIDGSQVVAPTDPLQTVHLNRDVKSAFGEVVVPVFSDSNAVTAFQELSLSASVRYDDYSDFGSVSNPKYGITWRPITWVALRGAWGDSFVAPSLADDSATTVDSATFAAAPFLFPPQELIDNGSYPPVQAGQVAILLQGTAPDIAPQTAETKSFGIDIEPPFIPGLQMSLTWWDIHYSGLISLPSFFSPIPSFVTFASFKTVNPTQGQIDEALAGVDDVVSTCDPQPDCVYVITDGRKNNTGDFKTDGLDLGTYYVHETSFGSIDFSLNSTYVLNREQNAAAGAEFTNVLQTDYSRFKSSASIGTNIGQLRAEATWYHTQGYDLGAPTGVPPQDDISSYDTVNLFFRYDLQGQGLLSDLELLLNINNVFDEDPPEYRITNTLSPSNSGYANGRTIGRLFEFGIRKRFN
ncbi:MAG: TonB-dependent receptor [Halioglobus sp.]|nr:TonB-dependent receptor [Halioglobus sp.]